MKMSDEKVLEAFRLRLAGVSATEIGRRLGVHGTYVGEVLRGESRAGAYPDHPDRKACVELVLKGRDERRDVIYRRVMGRTWARAVADYRAGHSLRSAAKRHGVHWVSLERYMRRRGIKRRPPSLHPKYCVPRSEWVPPT